MTSKNRDAAVLAGRGVRKHIPGGMQGHLSTLQPLCGARALVDRPKVWLAASCAGTSP
jgi:hypothetical protein